MEPRRAGRPRAFLVGLVLTVLTLGVYALVWHRRVHREVREEFALDRDGRGLSTGWFVAGILLPPLFPVYVARLVDDVRSARRHLGLAPGPPGWVAGLVVLLGILAYFAGNLVVIRLAPAAAADAGLVPWMWAAFAGALLALAGVVLEYRRLQADVNEIWSTRDSHPGEQAGGPREGASLRGSSDAG